MESKTIRDLVVSIRLSSLHTMACIHLSITKKTWQVSFPMDLSALLPKDTAVVLMYTSVRHE